ncbi:brain acid soluble protein 1-like isoform X1 [Microplitis mediator]|uniref:brain acid soluble protein 1-like isoform X1 n=1 Tax=Microplitis mediator TaxID=375433 RepID=UPI002555AA54|nr:brain acid soluble protein 1-like isoform X1 [Microplitis mediator]XP_057334815.1 brain acid soluble protein 1-like isoform X1 [Microplitis mediator]
MRFITTIVIAMCLIALVSSFPRPESTRFRSKMLERIMENESNEDPALRGKRTIGVLRQFFPSITKEVNHETENRVQDANGAESNRNEVKVQFADQDNQAEAANANDELPPLEEIEVPEDENRNKRFLSFGFGGSGGAAGGSGGGSGNFLFDIIRQAADGAARAAGTVYRVVAGTQSLGLGLSASRDLAPSPSPTASAAPAAAPAPAAPAAAPAPGTGTQPSLVAGSGSAPSDGNSAGRTDEAVPGPITRLFVIANRGISNLMQDIILRLAATSERIVNFKARLITSII